MRIRAGQAAATMMAVWLVGVAVAAAPQAGKAATPKRAPAATAVADDVKAIGSVKEIMLAVTMPTSATVFKAASDAPTDAQHWTHVRHEALALAESANLLLIAGRAPDADGWTRFAVAQRDAAVAAMKAADARDADALSNASDALYETCSNCHDRYMKK